MFSPYHRFPNCTRIESTISNLNDNNNIPEELFTSYNRYHFALVHKLKCAFNYVDSLNGLLTNTNSQQALADTNDFIFRVNMYLDGFFYTAGSSLDILAREILTYFGVSLPQIVYFRTAREIISRSRSGDPILGRLDDPSWKEDFSMYRNALTHELIVAGQFNINVRLDGATQEQTLILPLPDDPRLDISERTFRKYPNVIEYCEQHMRRILTFINTLYSDLDSRINDNGSLPI